MDGISLVRLKAIDQLSKDAQDQQIEDIITLLSKCTPDQLKLFDSKLQGYKGIHRDLFKTLVVMRKNQFPPREALRERVETIAQTIEVDFKQQFAFFLTLSTILGVILAGLVVGCDKKQITLNPSKLTSKSYEIAQETVALVIVIAIMFGIEFTKRCGSEDQIGIGTEIVEKLNFIHRYQTK